jgi:hypothetical protein
MEAHIPRKRTALEEWDETREAVRKGLERIGRDIPITGYGYKEELRELAKRRERATARG